MLPLLAAILGLLPLAAHAQNLALAKDGHTDYTIVVADDAIPAEKTAAAQLKKYLDQITGASFPIASESAVSSLVPQIVVGRGKRTDEVLGQFDWSQVGADGIVIVSRGGQLVLSGDRPRGTLYAVFEFLESAANCNWWAPKAETIPKDANLSIPAQNTVYTPVFAYRETYSNLTMVHWPYQVDAKNVPDPAYDAYATIIHSNGHFQSQPPEWGGHYTLIGWCHTLPQLIPAKKYFAEHPEWFSDPSNHNLPCTAQSPMPVNKNGEGSGQYCFGAPGLIDEVAKNALELIRKDPSAGYISISQNDGSGNFCQGPDAQAFLKREGSQSGILIDFVNQVAEKIHAEFPGFKIETLAYQDGIKPPKTVRPGKDVIIRLAPLGADFGHPLDSEANKETRDLIAAWREIAPELFIWTYATNYSNSFMPHPNWDAFPKDIKLFAANHVKGVFEQGNLYTSEVGDFCELRAWLTAKLLWNPDLDPAALTDQFMQGYYGAAAPFMKDERDLVQEAFNKTKKRLGAYQEDFAFLDIDVMTKATELLNSAAAAVKDDPALLDHVTRTRVSLDYAWLYNYKALKNQAKVKGIDFMGPATLEEGIAAFNQYVAKYHIVNGGEIPSIQKSLAQIAEKNK
jgi:hypothetical protein